MMLLKCNLLLFLTATLWAFNVMADATGDVISENGDNEHAKAMFATAKTDSGRLFENEANFNSVNVKLHGIFISDKTRVAYISVNGDEQRDFAEGRKIFDGCYLKTILPNRIVIRGDDGETVLKLKATANKLSAGKALSYRPTPALHAHAAAASRPPIDGIKRIQSNHLQIERALLQKELESGKILSQARMLPEEDGGFFVERIKEGSLIEAVGLHVGDVIQSVNDRPLNSLFDVLDALGQTESIDEFEIQITRGGDTQHLYYQLQ